MRYIIATFVLLSLGIASCDGVECTNHNPIFEQHAPTSKEYKSELVKQLQQRNFSRIDYSIKGYEEIDSIAYMKIDISGKNLCAIGYLDIQNTEELEQFKKVKGVSYSGAGLEGLVYHIDSSDGNYNFIFDDVVWIVD